MRASGGGATGAVAGERPEGSGPPGSAYIGFLGQINIFFRVYSIRLYLLAIAIRNADVKTQHFHTNISFAQHYYTLLVTIYIVGLQFIVFSVLLYVDNILVT